MLDVNGFLHSFHWCETVCMCVYMCVLWLPLQFHLCAGIFGVQCGLVACELEHLTLHKATSRVTVTATFQKNANVGHCIGKKKCVCLQITVHCYHVIKIMLLTNIPGVAMTRDMR